MNPTDRAAALAAELAEIEASSAEAQDELTVAEATAASVRAVVGRLRQRRYFVKARLEREAVNLRNALYSGAWSDRQKEDIKRVLAFIEGK